ncbi:MAG: hypothetical protein B6I38_05555 [Anaerolineaceae bacterium 4572_5.1]|nr:MAG: hypothetical protein B5M51_07825 [Anaerolinea sp. 4484_236]OQY31646.1 MAG: hypothetical protein B6I38_05555 [Anaerolineaceae bacterium 4572_5.1]RLD04513.1 MAG: YggT family protein [Chloroflexota bacterium]
MINFLIYFVNIASRIIFWLVFLDIILSYFMDPFHPIRRNLDRVVRPMLAPIQRVVPPLGRIDFSPVILVVLVEIVASLLRYLLLSLII